MKRIKGGGLQQVAHRTDAANEQHSRGPDGVLPHPPGPPPQVQLLRVGPAQPAPDPPRSRAGHVPLLLREAGHGVARPRPSVLEVGCGWGAFILHAAETYPGVNFHGFSNSRTQIEYILSTASARGLKNVRVAVLDVNDFCDSGLPRSWPKLHDRVFSCECLEHSQDYGSVFRAVAQALKPEGLVFVHVLCHREYTYFMNGDDWMGANFFTGGTIPSTKLFMFFNSDLVVDDCWYLDGRHYARTADAWLRNLYSNADRALAVLGGREGPSRSGAPSTYSRASRSEWATSGWWPTTSCGGALLDDHIWYRGRCCPCTGVYSLIFLVEKRKFPPRWHPP